MTRAAEQWNGRLAMLGIAALAVTQVREGRFDKGSVTDERSGGGRGRDSGRAALRGHLSGGGGVVWQRVGDARTAAAQVLRVGCPHIDGPAILGKEVPPLRCSPTRMSIRKGGEREQEGEWEREGEREQGRRFSLPSSSPFLSPSSPLPSDLRPPPPPLGAGTGAAGP